MEPQVGQNPGVELKTSILAKYYKINKTNARVVHIEKLPDVFIK